jgi:thioredoxin 2
MMAPVIDLAAKALEASMRVAKLNTEAEGSIAARFAIRSIPTLAIFYHGRIISQRSGAIDLARLIEWARSAVPTTGSRL